MHVVSCKKVLNQCNKINYLPCSSMNFNFVCNCHNEFDDIDHDLRPQVAI